MKNAGEMAEKAAFRGHSREAYPSALGDLIGRGGVRAADELATDRFFYTPWQVLSATEIKDLNELLTRLKRALAHTVGTVPA